MQDAWRAYLQLALGLTEASKKRAQKVAKKLVGTSGVTAAQVQAFVEELASTSAANREALTKLVRFEVDRALGAVGLATGEEVADLRERVRELERDLQKARAAGARAATTVTESPMCVPSAGGGAAPADAGATVAKKAVAKKAVAKKAVVKSPGAAVTQATSGQVVAATTPVKKAVAKKTVAKKAVAKKTGGVRAPDRSTPPGSQP